MNFDKGKKVIICIPHLKQGGSERATSELANLFVKEQTDVTVLLMYNKEKSYHLDKNVNLVEPQEKWNRLPKLFYPLFILWFLRRRIRLENADSILCMGYKTFTLIACMGLNIRVVDSIRTSPYHIRFPESAMKNALYYFVRSIVNRRIDGVVAQTERAATELRNKMNSTEVKVIPNTVRKINRFNVEKENLVLSVGRFERIKGHKYLIEAFSKANIGGWKLCLLGDGTERMQLEALSGSLGIRDKILFEGFRSDVDRYMQKSKIFVLPSLAEGFPNSLVEAMANGMACISFDCESGPSEIVTNGKDGILVKVGDVDALAGWIARLANDSEMRDGLGWEAVRAASQYETDRIVSDYLDFLFKRTTKKRRCMS